MTELHALRTSAGLDVKNVPDKDFVDLFNHMSSSNIDGDGHKEYISIDIFCKMIIPKGIITQVKQQFQRYLPIRIQMILEVQKMVYNINLIIHHGIKTILLTIEAVAKYSGFNN